MEGTITLTQAQLRKLQVIDRYRSKAITRKKAAEILGLSERQVTRLKKGVEAEGAAFVINKNTGKTPVHAIKPETKERILQIRAESAFQEANFTHRIQRCEASSQKQGSKVRRASVSVREERSAGNAESTQVNCFRLMLHLLNGSVPRSSIRCMEQ